MKKNQYITILIALVVTLGLFLWGKTVNPNKQKQAAATANKDEHEHAINFNDILKKAKERLSVSQSTYVTGLENSISRGNVKEQQIFAYKQLANFWKDSVRIFEPYAFYTAEAAKLENSEKSLTFAAQLFVDNLFDEQEPAMQNWLASNGKDLLEKALAINPNNDSSKIGLGACYVLGNISNNPMEGILPVREIATKNPNNIYAQWVLGLGGKKSGQYQKAAERFLIIVQKEPQNLMAMLHLAECYDLANDKPNAIKWYTTVKNIIPNANAKKELEERIKQLNK